MQGPATSKSWIDTDHSDAEQQSSTVLRKRHCDDLGELESDSWVSGAHVTVSAPARTGVRSSTGHHTKHTAVAAADVLAIGQLRKVSNGCLQLCASQVVVTSPGEHCRPVGINSHVLSMLQDSTLQGTSSVLSTNWL
jgi:hypothetical protein